MVKNKRLFLLVIVSIVGQLFFFKQSGLELSKFPFLDGVPLTSSNTLTYQYLLYWFFPIAVMSFYFSGDLRDSIRIRGLPYITRRYNKTHFIIKQFISMFLTLSMFVGCQFLFFYVFDMSTYELLFEDYAKMTILYVASLLLIFSAQMSLELIVKSEISQAMTCVYIVVPALLSKELVQNFLGFNYLFLSNYSMGLRNGFNNFNPLSESLVSGTYVIGIIAFLELSIILLSVKRFKNMDIM